jgi:hypothetical protein
VDKLVKKKSSAELPLGVVGKNGAVIAGDVIARDVIANGNGDAIRNGTNDLAINTNVIEHKALSKNISGNSLLLDETVELHQKDC